MKTWIYNKALNFILDQHSLWLASKGGSGTRLDFSGRCLRQAVFNAADLDSAKFLAARIDNADFTRAAITRCNLTNVQLTDCNTSGTNFSGSLGKLWGEDRAKLIDSMHIVATPNGAELRKKDE